MIQIKKYDKNFDSLQELKKIVDQCYLVNKKFFKKDVGGIKIDFFYSRSEMDKKLERKTPDWWVGSAKNKNIFIFSPTVYDQVSSHPKSDFKPTLTHEIGHAFVNELFGFVYPKWLSEGLPGYIAKQYKKFSNDIKIVSFSKLHDREGWNKYHHYPQAFLFTKYLVDKYGEKTVLLFMSKLGRNDSFKETSKKFEEVFKKNLKQVKENWIKEIK